MIRKMFELVKKIHTMTGNRTELERITTSLDSVNEKIEALMAEKKDKAKKK
jgi:tetrahydromethanopterin S-methyltransferase subunit G